MAIEVGARGGFQLFRPPPPPPPRPAPRSYNRQTINRLLENSFTQQNCKFQMDHIQQNLKDFNNVSDATNLTIKH